MVLNGKTLSLLDDIADHASLAKFRYCADRDLAAIDTIDVIITLAQEAKTILQEQDVPIESKYTGSLKRRNDEAIKRRQAQD